MQYNSDTNVEGIALFLSKSKIYNNTLPDKALSIRVLSQNDLIST
jgi:hypothetical protein